MTNNWKKKAPSKRNKNQHKFLHKEEIIVPATRDDGLDMISELPEDILASIISWLPLAEAVSTSILSTRWRHLHTYATRLKFSPPKQGTNGDEDDFPHNESSDEQAFSKYADMVNRTLDLHKGGRFLEEFRIHDLPCYRGRLPWAHIERWLEFALSKHVQIIDIHMNDARSYVYFPVSSFITENIALSGFKSIKELSLRAIDVDDQDVELLLESFILLERLSIEDSNMLKDLFIFDELAPNLKYLNVSSCMNIDSIEIKGAKNLVSLRPFDLTPSYALVLKDVPMLIEFSTCDNSGYAIDQIFLEGIISEQLVKLSLSTDPCHVMTCDVDYVLPKLINLKHMEVEANMYSGCSGHQLIHMIEACPRLQKLEIKFIWWGSAFEDREVCRHTFQVKTNHHLKRVKLSGFLGCPSELEFGSHVIAKAMALEELVIETWAGSRKLRRKARARMCQQLGPIMRNSVILTII